ncbi:protease modulator HflC [Caldilinea sp.]|uniref:protease modulator HflC n=1 Tax=Caldilinea sp. TaxID=2293560 RepID=UPI002C2498F9|nr:protease modulator HflC [Caldilinea sp.]HRA67761.1 protease modulator HflC [Caldilinea sp.]
MRGLITTVAVILVIGGLFFLSQSLFTVDETQQAIILQFGDPVATIQEPGLAFKLPFIQNVITFDKRVLSSDAPPQEYLTSDKKRLVVDHVTRWRISDPLAFFKAVRTEAGARARLDDIIFSELRRELATVEFLDVISTQREAIEERVAASALDKAAEFGITVLDVRTKRADLPQEVEQSVFDRMRAERQRESSLLRAEGEELGNIIRAQADRSSAVIVAEGEQQAQRLRGEGEAEAIGIYAEALSQDLEFYAFTRRLQAYDTILKSGDRLVIPADTDFFRYLLTSSGASDELAPIPDASER